MKLRTIIRADEGLIGEECRVQDVGAAIGDTSWPGALALEDAKEEHTETLRLLTSQNAASSGVWLVPGCDVGIGGCLLSFCRANMRNRIRGIKTIRMSNARRASAILFEKNLIRDPASFTEAKQTASRL